MLAGCIADELVDSAHFLSRNSGWFSGIGNTDEDATAFAV
jgi:hypothetical protein